MDFTGKTASPRALSADGRVWFLLTADKGAVRKSLAVEARDSAHAEKRVRLLLLANGFTVYGCVPITRELWTFVDKAYPLPVRT